MIAPSAPSADAGAEPSWTAVRSADLVWCTWDHEYVLYHRPSGKTHFLNEAGWLLLARILSVPRPLELIVDELASMQALPATDELRSYVMELLLRFEELGLVDRT